MRNTNRCEDALSQAHLEHLLLETNTMRKINEFSRPTISQQSFHLDRSVLFRLSNYRRKNFPKRMSDLNSNPSLLTPTWSISVSFRSSYNSLMKQVVDFKIILHQLKRILEQVESETTELCRNVGCGWLCSCLLKLFLHLGQIT